MKGPRGGGVGVLIALVVASACGSSEDDASPPPDQVDKRSLDERASDAEVAAVRSYVREKFGDARLANELGFQNLDNALVSLHSAPHNEAWLRAIRRRDDPALKGVDIDAVKIASVFGGNGGGSWLLVIIDAGTGRPLTVVQMWPLPATESRVPPR